MPGISMGIIYNGQISRLFQIPHRPLLKKKKKSKVKSQKLAYSSIIYHAACEDEHRVSTLN